MIREWWGSGEGGEIDPKTGKRVTMIDLERYDTEEKLPFFLRKKEETTSEKDSVQKLKLKGSNVQKGSRYDRKKDYYSKKKAKSLIRDDSFTTCKHWLLRPGGLYNLEGNSGYTEAEIASFAASFARANHNQGLGSEGDDSASGEDDSGEDSASDATFTKYQRNPLSVSSWLKVGKVGESQTPNNVKRSARLQEIENKRSTSAANPSRNNKSLLPSRTAESITEAVLERDMKRYYKQKFLDRNGNARLYPDVVDPGNLEFMWTIKFGTFWAVFHTHGESSRKVSRKVVHDEGRLEVEYERALEEKRERRMEERRREERRRKDGVVLTISLKDGTVEVGEDNNDSDTISLLQSLPLKTPSGEYDNRHEEEAKTGPGGLQKMEYCLVVLKKTGFFNVFEKRGFGMYTVEISNLPTGGNVIVPNLNQIS
jgi:hypothetical protein